MIKKELNRKPQQLLSFLGADYEKKLLHQIIGFKVKKGDDFERNFKYGEEVLPITHPHHFDDSEASIILLEIKEYYEYYHAVPYYDTLKGLLKSKYGSDTAKQCINYLVKVHNVDKNDHIWVRDSAKKFVKMQNLIAASDELRKIALTGQYEQYDDCVDIVLEAIQTNDVEENHYIVEAENYDDMDAEKREPTSVGWGDALDECLNGGIAKGELMVVIAGSGVGKTTLATIAANHLFSQGKTVLQVFFEDTKTQIRQKQRARWTGIDISQIVKGNNLQLVKKRSDKKIYKSIENGGTWILKKFRRSGTRTTHLINYLRKLESLGLLPDYIIVDYLECFEPKKDYRDDWAGEKEIIIDLEDIASEDDGFNCGIITFTQGNRGSMNAEFVDSSQMGGNFKKFQIGHIIISLARTMQQMRENRANASILKSRVGLAGINFKDFYLDNGKVAIDINRDSIFTEDEYAEVKEL
jgi:energy-coupling factor transporter ATP-binding protein EcfA2